MDFLLSPIEAIHDLVGLGYRDMPHVYHIVKPNLLTVHHTLKISKDLHSYRSRNHVSCLLQIAPRRVHNIDAGFFASYEAEWRGWMMMSHCCLWYLG